MKKLLFLLLIISACAGDDENPKPIYRIDPAFQTQVDAFYAEALARGHGEFEKENLIVQEYDRTSQPNSNTSYAYKKKGQNYIEVYKADPFNCREAIVFRELAHLLLKKPYIEDNSNDHNSYIMDPLFNACVYVHADGDFYPWREDYMVQLFGE